MLHRQQRLVSRSSNTQSSSTSTIMLRATAMALSRIGGPGASSSPLLFALASSTSKSPMLSKSSLPAIASFASRAVTARAAKASASSATSSSSLSEKAKAVDSVMKDINARFGKGSIMFLGGEPEKMETISTGALTLDVALGGGLPKGRIVEIYGPESSGKTTIALHAIAEVQKKGGRAALIDAEHAFDPIYAAALGIKLPDLLISQPESGEMALEIVDQLVRSDAFDLVAVDSVAALTPKAELEGEIGQATIGLQARLLSAALRKVAANASKSKTTILMLNQLRMKIGVVYGNPEVTPGGNALKFYASARVDVRRKAALDAPSGSASSGINAGVSPGIRVRAKVVKNKCAPPYRVAEFDILFNSGINNTGCVLEAAEGVGVVERKGAWFYLASDGTRLGQGKDRACAALEADPKLRAKVEEETRERLDGRMAKKGGGAVVPASSGSLDEEGEEGEIDAADEVGAAAVGSATLEAAGGGSPLAFEEEGNASDAAA